MKKRLKLNIRKPFSGSNFEAIKLLQKADLNIKK